VSLLTSFELATTYLTDKETSFNKYDEVSFPYKFLTRFGASSVSATIAAAITYPLDTIKKRMQVDACKAFKNTKTGNSEFAIVRHIINVEGP